MFIASVDSVSRYAFGANGSFIIMFRRIISFVGVTVLLIICCAWVAPIYLRGFSPFKTEQSQRNYIQVWHNFINSWVQPFYPGKRLSSFTLFLVWIHDHLFNYDDSFQGVKYIFSLPWNEIDNCYYLRLTI